MQMNRDKVRILQQMGLGPVWQRRGLSVTKTADMPAADSMPATDVLSSPGMMSAPDTQDSEWVQRVMAMDWATLEDSIRQCDRCSLCQGRTQAVPGIGDRHARWLFVGEGPGRQEDIQGEPFVGPAGKLLDNMLRALGLARGTQTYIANIVKCRPTGPDGRDRPPATDEVAACLPYLQRQIALIQPDVIVALGKTAAVALLNLPPDTALGGLRGKPHTSAQVPVVVTYHPAYLLRQPADKAKSWRDLCLAKRLVDGR